MHFSTMCSLCPRDHLLTDTPKQEIYFQLVCHSRAEDTCIKQCMAEEERKKVRLVFCDGDRSQFQCSFLFQQSYIKMKAFTFSKGDGRKAVHCHPWKNGSATVGRRKGRPSLLTSTFRKIWISSWRGSRQMDRCI